MPGHVVDDPIVLETERCRWVTGFRYGSDERRPDEPYAIMAEEAISKANSERLCVQVLEVPRVSRAETSPVALAVLVASAEGTAPETRPARLRAW